MAQIDGNTLIARSLKKQGVEHMFGIVGFPVFGIAAAAQAEGIQFIGMRNEQAASYAAGAVGYFTGRPGVCLTVSGPGMIHGIAGLANSQENCWPMMLIGGASNSFQEGMGAFQEAPQVELARIYSKYAARPDSPSRIPFYCEQAVRSSINGRPGATYLDFPDDFLSAKVEESDIAIPGRCPEPPRTQADAGEVQRAIDVLRSAERPLVIIGKGAAYSRAEDEVRRFIESTRLPFLTSPMGKGVVDDEHALSVMPARGLALQDADVVLLLGARLNWIMHFGMPPRFAEGVKTIQVDIHAEEIGRNVPAEVGLVGDIKAVAGQLNQALEADPFAYASDTPWWETLSAKVEENKTFVQNMMNDDSVPMGYYRVLREIQDQAPPGTIIQAEGANTMDISRSVLMHENPRERIDAATFGTMGVGLAQAIAAQVVHPNRKVICVEGDSAFKAIRPLAFRAWRWRPPVDIGCPSCS
jgi:2-hydroxyacyl-CoA lyase 1